MNSFRCIHIEYLRSSRTIETIVVSKGSRSRVFWVYNYEGVSFRLFENHLGLINFFRDKSKKNYHFSTEEELDGFLANVDLGG